MARADAKPTLIVFGGLPGVGKTTLARALALELGVAYLRIDDIEEALRGSGFTSEVIGASGYLVAYALAESNLRLGTGVVADSVNPNLLTRKAWRGVAEKASANIVEVEIICSDEDEHRRRVESRAEDITGLRMPTWQQITERPYEGWERDRLVIDLLRRANLAKAQLRPGQAPAVRSRDPLSLDITHDGGEAGPAATSGIVAGGPKMVAPEFLADLGQVALAQKARRNEF
jgi:predicted kinase